MRIGRGSEVTRALHQAGELALSGAVRAWRAVGPSMIEVTAIVIVAVWVGRDYLNFNPAEIPTGREFMMVIQSHNLWEVFKECGWCAVWNGSTSGGYPAAAELFGAPLHPIVAVTTLLWGVFNGTKVALVASLAVAGLAQWWLARELGVSSLPRVWSALIAVAGGHLAGRMDDGAFTILLSTAVVSLVIPAILAIERRASRASVAVLAFTLASAILSGQGYLQLGLLASSPAALFLLLDHRLKPRRIWREYALACGLAALLSAPLLVPLVHFLPNFGKPLDPTFQSAPPLEVLPLNLVIRDSSVYRGAGTLGMIAAPAPYTLFVGWLPVIMAVLGLGLARGESRRRILYLASGAFLVFLLASDALLQPLVKILPSMAAIRFPSFSAGLAVPMILGIAAYGLDRLLRIDWPRILIYLEERGISQRRGISLKWMLIVPLVMSVRSSATYAHEWLRTSPQGDDVPWVLETLRTPGLEWVSPPFGEHYFITPAIVSGLKVSPGLKPWGWKGREVPLARVGALRGPNLDESATSVAESYGIFVYLLPDEHYAAVAGDQGRTPCSATGKGGRIHVLCDNSAPGRLVVKEYTWTGWSARRDGTATPLLGETWLEVDAPAGRHTYEFLYLPWDVSLGLALAAIGLVICCVLWFGGSGNGRDVDRVPLIEAQVRVEQEAPTDHPL